MYDLGFNYNKEYTVFKIYAPQITSVKLLLYENYDDVRYNSIDMKKVVDILKLRLREIWKEFITNISLMKSLKL